MCGIAGFYGFKDDDLIKRISKELAHRGPDGEGYFFDGTTTTLLNRRLAIIDREKGDQPIYNEDQSLVVVFNGEIYNFRQLKIELKKHIFKTNSDTEVIVHAYEEWGENCFDKFNGMFTIALYDKKKKKLILARDHFGIKPLYYSILNSKNLIFSSEIKPLLNSNLIGRKANEKTIYRYLRYRVHDDTDETFFNNIKRLMPGELLIVEKKEIKRKYFSRLEEELLGLREKKFEREDIDTFKNKLTDAIKLRLISEVPVGTSFSGGLDSSTVVSVIHELLKKKDKEAASVGKVQNTFSAVFPNIPNNEEKYVDELIKDKHEIRCHKVYPTPEIFFEEIENFIRTQEEPTISTGPYAQYKVMEEAKKYVTVLLDGQGSDEMMAGYLPYYFVYLKELRKKGKYLAHFKEVLFSLDIILKFIQLKFSGKNSVNVSKVLNHDFIHKFKVEALITTNDDLKKRLVEDIFHNSLPSLLRYEDKNSMKYSLEGRVPFLDFNLLRFIFSLSNEAIIKNGWNKYILRKAVKKLLPRSIVKRRNKIGFTTPEVEWFLRMKNKIYGYFLSESFAKRSYFNQQEVLKSFQEFIEGKNEDTMLFWRLLNLELWLRLFIDKEDTFKEKEKKVSPNIKVGNKQYIRYLIKTDVFEKGDDSATKVSVYVRDWVQELSLKNWFVVVSEKVIAISQGRSYFLWEINPGFFAKSLSRFVKKTPYGIGLGSPWTMQLAIQEVGLSKILLATFLSALTKPIGIKGVFYHVAGREVASIDGPTEYSLYPSNVSAKLGPKNPEKVVGEIHQEISSKFEYRNPKQIKNLNHEKTTNYKLQTTNFLGIVIIDANDLGQTVLGNSTSLPDAKIAKIFKDNPMGQSDEQTPVVLVFEQK